jgi:hypothetical protein
MSLFSKQNLRWSLCFFVGLMTVLFLPLFSGSLPAQPVTVSLVNAPNLRMVSSYAPYAPFSDLGFDEVTASHQELNFYQ